jgi:DNA-binding GntR family transcriptional regulator
MDLPNPMAESGETLRKRSLADEVYDHLYRKIIAGKYSPGDWLRQEDISTQLGVSQTPVREALDRLVASELAERVPFRGVRVPALETNEIVDAFTMRLVLESLAARLAAQVISPEEVQSLSMIIEKTASLVSLEDMSTLRQLNKEFHTCMVGAAGNPLLTKLYEMATNSFPDWMLYEYMFRHPELMQSSLRREYLEHKSIVDALACNDPEEAAARVIQHISNLGAELESYLNISHQTIEEVISRLTPVISSHQNE